MLVVGQILGQGQELFSGASGVYGLSIDVSNNFLYAANNATNTVSGFVVDKTTGDL
jgi:6-phosphogluconolactonase (cycloisomerase 2 family)